MAWLNDVLEGADHSARLQSDLQYFCKHALKLRPKAGPLVPFLFNPAQQRLHEIIEKQKAETGRVRCIVLKARQLGVSTYVAARLYHRTINNPGLRTIILGHEKRASSNLFQIVKRFHDHLPDAIKPSIGVSNAEELIFDRLDSGYIVSVASPDGAGRSATAQLLHASEAAFWDGLPAQMASLLQTVPDIDSTEIIIESTANGYNDFHGLWRKAEAGQSEFLPIFLPWSLDPEYRRPVDDKFEMDETEQELCELYDLDEQQIAWRRAKVGQLGNADLLTQEYPLCASEAFVSAEFDSFIPATLVLQARREVLEPWGPLVIGVDPAGMGADRTSVAWRRGHAVIKVVSRRGLDTMQTAGWLSKIIADDEPDVVLKAALEEGRFSLPDSDSLQADLVSVGYKYDSGGRLVLESKIDMRRRGLPSPDEGDSVALTFAQPDGYSRPKGFNRRELEYPEGF